MNSPIKFAFVLLAALLAGGCGSQNSGSHSQDISQTELIKLSETDPSLLILDVRTPQEYAQGHVPKAKLIPHTELKSRLAEINDAKDKTVVVYCKSGYRAGIAQSILTEAGFTRVMHLDGDMSGWKSAKLPIER